MNLKPDTLKLELDTTELDGSQKRLIKKINTLLTHVMTTDEESEYFEDSTKLMKLIATAVKDANFSKFWSENSNIPYAEQALEFCVDSISEDLSDTNLVQFDN